MRPLNTVLDRISAGVHLCADESHALFGQVISGELEPVEIAALLIALKTRGEQVNEIVGAARAMRENAKPFETPNYLFADNCGTGGDGLGTINVSTAAAFVAAELGVPVAKHGNRSVSSRCGSADLLEACGVEISIPAERSRQCLDQVGVCFLFAPDYHAGVRYAMAVRKRLKTRTLFNLLGPLANPAKPPVQLLGVYDKRWVLPLAESLGELGCTSAMVVHGGGLDEIALHAPTAVAMLKDGKLDCFELEPGDLGLERYPLDALQGGGPEDNAAWLIALLGGQGKPAHRAAVAMNAGALVWLAGNYDDLAEAVQAALQVLNEDHALQRLTRLKELSRGAD
ncbi:MAG: anthranilate phosphoribosyltransferase [Gammaproteobacteria bacterium]